MYNVNMTKHIDRESVIEENKYIIHKSRTATDIDGTLHTDL